MNIKIKYPVKFFIIISLIFFSFPINVHADIATEIEKGKSCYLKGDFESAALVWEKTRESLDMEKDSAGYIDVTIHLVGAYQSLGYYRKALSVMADIKPVIEKNSDIRRSIQFYGLMGDLYLSYGDSSTAAAYIAKGTEQARILNDPRLIASILIDAGNLFTADRDYDGAVSTYSEVIEIAESINDMELKATALINSLYAAMMSGSYEGFDTDYLLKHIKILPDSHEKADNLIRAGLMIRSIREALEEEKRRQIGDQLLMSAYQSMNDAIQLAESLGNIRILSYAYGYLGQFYEEEKRYSDALTLTRRAMFFAQQGDYSHILYLWQWQLARIFSASGNKSDAISAYKSAISTLTPIRLELFSGLRMRRDTFNDEIKAVYLGLAGLLIEQAETMTDNANKENMLKQAIDTMELLKTAELQDFFDDECSTTIAGKSNMLDRAPAQTAIIYPIVFIDKLSILLTMPDCIQHISIPVSAETLNETVTHFRRQLQNRMNNRFLYDAEKLYEWIIRPIIPQLSSRNIDTIVFAPDGALRMIPLSTLYDGKQFLVEKYAIAVIPATTLTDPHPFPNENIKILLSGLSEARQDFSALPSVPAELRDIKTIMDGRKVLMNNEFTVENLKDEFRSQGYTIFHMATHGVFGGTPDESFLLSYNGRLNMNGLEQLISIGRFREMPVELLTLSACQTALGNERAALGLAGVAVKAGVRAAIATLWYVDDEATSLAIREFYRQLKTPGISKAKALQNAQKKLIEQQRYWQPLYWAPFVLIGNWM